MIFIHEERTTDPLTDDMLVARNALMAGAYSTIDELTTERRRVAIVMAKHDECITVTKLQELLPDIDFMVTMLLGELQADGFVDQHTHENDTTKHYHLTPAGERYLRAA